MLCYCFKRRKITESKNPKGPKTKNRRIYFYQTLQFEKSKLFKEQEASGLIGSPAKSLSRIPFTGAIY